MFMLLTTVNMPNKKMAGATPLSPTIINVLCNVIVHHVGHLPKEEKCSKKW